MGDLSEHFSSVEFACPCCDLRAVKPTLVAALQVLRYLAGVPIHITSGCRCRRWNTLKGGGIRSQHLKGRAADIVITGLEPEEMKDLALDVPAFRDGGIGVYPENGFIHVDVRGRRARWTG